MDRSLPGNIRDALFLAASRTYAEQYIEPLLRAKFELELPTAGDHDATDGLGNRYEIKASKVMRRRQNGSAARSLLDRILFELSDSPLSRYFDAAAAAHEDFDANIQNVKRSHFDVLLYALLFRDTILIFSAKSEDIGSGRFPNWSDKHGRYDQEGMSGQFPISRRNIDWHLANTYLCAVTYREAVQIYRNL